MQCTEADAVHAGWLYLQQVHPTVVAAVFLLHGVPVSCMLTLRLAAAWRLCASSQAIATTLHLTVDSITGLPASALGPAGSSTTSNSSSSSGTASPTGTRKAGGPRIALVVVDTLTQ